MAGGTQNDPDDAIVGINVTPLVDVMLVLLIIMIVTAKQIVSQSVPLDLPKAASGSEVQVIFSVSLEANNTTLVDSKPVANDDVILPLARDAHAKNNELRAVIKAESAVPHGRVIHVLDLLKQAGVSKIAFGVTPVAPMAPQNPQTPPAPQAPVPQAPAPK